MIQADKYVLIPAEYVERVEKIIENAIKIYKSWEKENFTPDQEFDYETNEWTFTEYDPETGYHPDFTRINITDSNAVLYELWESGHDCSDYLLSSNGKITELLDENNISFEIVFGIDRNALQKHPYIHGADQFYVIDRGYAKLHDVGDVI